MVTHGITLIGSLSWRLRMPGWQRSRDPDHVVCSETLIMAAKQNHNPRKYDKETHLLWYCYSTEYRWKSHHERADKPARSLCPISTNGVIYKNTIVWLGALVNIDFLIVFLRQVEPTITRLKMLSESGNSTGMLFEMLLRRRAISGAAKMSCQLKLPSKLSKHFHAIGCTAVDKRGRRKFEHVIRRARVDSK